jgi:hypothetical protein
MKEPRGYKRAYDIERELKQRTGKTAKLFFAKNLDMDDDLRQSDPHGATRFILDNDSIHYLSRAGDAV